MVHFRTLLSAQKICERAFALQLPEIKLIVSKGLMNLSRQMENVTLTTWSTLLRTLYNLACSLGPLTSPFRCCISFHNGSMMSVFCHCPCLTMSTRSSNCLCLTFGSDNWQQKCDIFHGDSHFLLQQIFAVLKLTVIKDNPKLGGKKTPTQKNLCWQILRNRPLPGLQENNTRII